MKKIYIVCVLIAGVFILNACDKDTDIFVPNPNQLTGPDSSWYSPVSASMPVNDLQQSLLLAPDIDSIDAGSTDTIHSTSGLQCIFPAGSSVDVNALPVSGKIYVESFLITTKGGMISMGLPTTSNGNLLVSGGVFSIHLKKDNAAIQLAPGTELHIEISDTAVSQQMHLFNGVTTPGGQPDWIPNSMQGNYISFGYNEYKVTTTSLNWINCDYFYGDTLNANNTAVSVKLPSNLTNANTIAYVVFDDVRSVMNMYGDAVAKQFTTGKVPVDMHVTIVTISKDGNFYYLGTKKITTALPTTGSNSQSVVITPIRYSLDDIKNYLKYL